MVIIRHLLKKLFNCFKKLYMLQKLVPYPKTLNSLSIRNLRWFRFNIQACQKHKYLKTHHLCKLVKDRTRNNWDMAIKGHLLQKLKNCSKNLNFLQYLKFITQIQRLLTRAISRRQNFKMAAVVNITAE